MKQKWHIFNYEGWLVVLPTPDKLPHSHLKKPETIGELAMLDCPCAPRVEKTPRGALMLVHSSFYDKQRIKSSLTNLFV